MRISALTIDKFEVKEGDPDDKSDPHFKYSLVLNFSKAEARDILDNGYAFKATLEVDHKTTESEDLGPITVFDPRNKKAVSIDDDLSFVIPKESLFILDGDHYAVIHIRVPVNKDDTPDGENGKLENEEFVLKVKSLDGKSVDLKAHKATIEDDDVASDDRSYTFGDTGDDEFDIIDDGPGFEFDRGDGSAGLLIGTGDSHIGGRPVFGPQEETPEFEPVPMGAELSRDEFFMPLVEQDTLF